MFNPLASDLFLQGVTTYSDHYQNGTKDKGCQNIVKMHLTTLTKI